METYMFFCNVYMKAQYHGCFHVLLQLVVTFVPTGKGSIVGYSCVHVCMLLQTTMRRTSAREHLLRKLSQLREINFAVQA